MINRSLKVYVDRMAEVPSDDLDEFLDYFRNTVSERREQENP